MLVVPLCAGLPGRDQRHKFQGVLLSLVSESPVPEDVECKESGGLLCPVEEEAVMSQKKQDIDSTQLQMLFLVLLRVDRYFLYNGGKSSPRYLPKVPLRWGVRRFSAWQPLSAGVVRPSSLVPISGFRSAPTTAWYPCL